ncbi:MAG TPA: ABC transporter substrate-binding protein [Verrucomicrobiae bacterium]|jgi:NitT/TauT family transport system substrate-binding protein|nr:ABC transporter substrate-binding protein [Verrucomicrobiae bacterium]
MSRDAEGRSVVDVTLAESVAEYQKYSGWPELKESFMAGKVRAAYLLAPMVMDLVESGVPAKIVSLGHRSGAVIMVRADSPAQSFRDLHGKRVAIPSRFAVDHLFVRRMLKDNGMTVRDIELIEMAPPDMPAALYARQVDAYATGEPFGAVAEVGGYARILYMTRDKWPNYVCCVLTVHQDLIDRDRATVQQLVSHVLSAGTWLEAAQANRDLAADLAAGPGVFNQRADILKHVLSNPRDRVTYADLRLVRSEVDELMEAALEAGVIRQRIAYERYVDESFQRNARPVDIHVAR